MSHRPKTKPSRMVSTALKNLTIKPELSTMLSTVILPENPA